MIPSGQPPQIAEGNRANRALSPCVLLKLTITDAERCVEELPAPNPIRAGSSRKLVKIKSELRSYTGKSL